MSEDSPSPIATAALTLSDPKAGGNVDRAGLKDRLWHAMRADLSRFMPAILESDLLLCPTCCRLLKYEDFDIEHILPKQAVDCDPDNIRTSIRRDVRSGVILLCRKSLKVNGIKRHGLGCNSWKGKNYDASIAAVLKPNAVRDQSGGRAPWTTSMFAAGFLAMFHNFGYGIALTKAGLLLRKQFFTPGAYLPDVPVECQLILMGDNFVPPSHDMDYWTKPFRFVVEPGVCMTLIRHVAVRMPLSRDPALPIAKHVHFAPKRFVFAPNYYTVFD